VNIQSISSHAPVESIHNPQNRFLSKPNQNSIQSETLYSVDKIPVIPPQKLVELLSLVNSAPDIIRNHTRHILDIRA
jgi:hypothetical protein